MFQRGRLRRWVADNLAQEIEGSPIEINILPVASYDANTNAAAPPALRFVKPLLLVELFRKCGSGVYFLCKGEDVVYVGQAQEIMARVGAHVSFKEFDRVYYTPVPKSDLSDVETAFIHALRPRYNFSKTGYLVTPRAKDNVPEGVLQQAAQAVQKSNSLE
jgi:hypothetical protein